MEIKFRAWDGKQYHYQDDQYLSSFIWRFVRGINHDNGLNSEHEAYLKWHLNDYLEQFTNMMDKNGKEIYKGDIVEFEYGIPKITVRSVIKFIEDEARFSPVSISNETYFRFEDAYYNTLVVIGNIHENPELLDVCNA